MTTFREQHWTDKLIAGRSRRRTIGNWRNYYNRQSGLFEPVDLEIEDDQTEPPEWEGTGPFSFRYQVKRGNLQIFAHDLATPNDAAVIGIRRADNPSHWLAMKALGGNTGSHIVYGPQKAIRWPDYWPNTRLNYQATASGVKKRIDLLAPGHPVYFEFSLKMPAVADVQTDGSGGVFIVAGGENKLHLRAPYGWDSTPDAELQPNIRVAGSIQSNTVNGNYRNVVVRLTPDGLDLSVATYPVFLDPSVTVSGETDVEDNFVFSSVPTLNYGGDLRMITYNISGNTAWQLIRIATIGAIPAGNITAFRLLMNAASGTGPDIRAYIVTDANDWIEGNQAGGVQTGSSCWVQAKWTVQNWAGHPTFGCSVSGTDFDADGSPPTLTTVPGWNTFTLKAAWPPLWRDAIRVSNGIIMFVDPGVDIRFSSVEGADKPYFEIDYSVGGAPVAAMIPRRIS